MVAWLPPATLLLPPPMKALVPLVLLLTPPSCGGGKSKPGPGTELACKQLEGSAWSRIESAQPAAWIVVGLPLPALVALTSESDCASGGPRDARPCSGVGWSGA